MSVAIARDAVRILLDIGDEWEACSARVVIWVELSPLDNVVAFSHNQLWNE